MKRYKVRKIEWILMPNGWHPLPEVTLVYSEEGATEYQRELDANMQAVEKYGIEYFNGK